MYVAIAEGRAQLSDSIHRETVRLYIDHRHERNVSEDTNTAPAIRTRVPGGGRVRFQTLGPDYQVKADNELGIGKRAQIYGLAHVQC